MFHETILLMKGMIARYSVYITSLKLAHSVVVSVKKMCRPACNGFVLQSEVNKNIITYLANSTQINGNWTHTHGQGDQYRRGWYGEGWGR